MGKRIRSNFRTRYVAVLGGKGGTFRHLHMAQDFCRRHRRSSARSWWANPLIISTSGVTWRGQLREGRADYRWERRPARG